MSWKTTSADKDSPVVVDSRLLYINPNEEILLCICTTSPFLLSANCKSSPPPPIKLDFTSTFSLIPFPLPPLTPIYIYAFYPTFYSYFQSRAPSPNRQNICPPPPFSLTPLKSPSHLPSSANTEKSKIFVAHRKKPRISVVG